MNNLNNNLYEILIFSRKLLNFLIKYVFMEDFNLLAIK